MKAMLLSLAVLAAPVTAQTATPPLITALPATPAPAAAPTSAAPVEHRLTPDEIVAAQADGAERNRAAEQLALTRGDPSLALPLERKKPVHGVFEVGVGSNGARELAGAVTTDLGDNGSATVAGSYTQFGRQRYRPF